MSKTIAFTGRRPKYLGGYDARKYANFCAEFMPLLNDFYNKGYTRFISGGAQGFDMLAFGCVDLLRQQAFNAGGEQIENIVYIPFEGQSDRWAEKGIFSQSDYNQMLALATDTKLVSDIAHPQGNFAIRLLMARNEAMIDDADLVVALYDGDDWIADKGGTSQAIRYAKKTGKQVFQVGYRINEDGLLSIQGKGFI